MLFHLFSQHANGYLTFPAAGGPYSISNRPGVGTVIDLCNSNGQTIERGLYYNDARNGPGFSDTRGDEFGHDTLEHNDIVTMAHPSGRFVTPRGSTLALETVQPLSARFQIKKVGGSSGKRIRHGDKVALGAVQPFNPRRRPNAQQLRWLQADPPDSDPTTNQVMLGGLSMNAGGDSQNFIFFEGNLLLGEANLTVSDRIPPGEVRPSGALKLRLSHEGLPNGSTARIRISAINAQAFALGSSGVTTFNPSAPPLLVTVPAGTREISLPMALVSPTASDACARFASLMAGAPTSGGGLDVIDVGMSGWNGPQHDGTVPRGVGINVARAKDWMDIGLGGNIGFSDDDGALFSRGGGNTFTVTVRSRGRILPPVPGPIPRIAGSGYVCSVTVTPFPTPGFATSATTPAPTRSSGGSPVLAIARDGSFSSSTTFTATPGPALDFFCIQVDIHPYRNVPNGVWLSRRMGLMV